MDFFFFILVSIPPNVQNKKSMFGFLVKTRGREVAAQKHRGHPASNVLLLLSAWLCHMASYVGACTAQWFSSIICHGEQISCELKWVVVWSGEYSHWGMERPVGPAVFGLKKTWELFADFLDCNILLLGCILRHKNVLIPHKLCFMHTWENSSNSCEHIYCW